MRDKNLRDPIQFEREIENYILRRLPPRTKDLRNQVLNNPNLNSSSCLFRLPRKEEEILGLSCLLWYLPEELRVLLLVEIERKHLSKKNEILKRILISSKENMILFLFLTKRWHSREIFGNLLRKGLLSLENLSLYREKRGKIRKKVFRRGYQDHGSKRLESEWLPTFDYSLTFLQNEKENKEENLNKLEYRILQILLRIREERLF